MNDKFFQTSTHTENGYTHTPLSVPLFVSALDTRLNYLPRFKYNSHRCTVKNYLNSIYGIKPKISDVKFKMNKRSFKIKPYHSILFKDIPFNLHWGED